LPEINYSDRKRRGYAERQAVNSVIQGSAADINKLALIRTHALKDPDMHIVATIHDEIVLEAPARSADRALTVVREGMLGAGVQELLSVPLACDSHVVTRWGDAK
jgi:DNA polymerase I-like protein with 3'-5' exonuclease and polymerase domains